MKRKLGSWGKVEIEFSVPLSTLDFSAGNNFLTIEAKSPGSQFTILKCQALFEQLANKDFEVVIEQLGDESNLESQATLVNLKMMQAIT